MCVLLITRLLRGVGRLACKPVNHTSWVAVVTLTDHPKSVRNRCLIQLFCGVVCVVTLPFWHFCWCRGFCHLGLSQISSFLSLNKYPRTTLKYWFVYIFLIWHFVNCWVGFIKTSNPFFLISSESQSIKCSLFIVAATRYKNTLKVEKYHNGRRRSSSGITPLYFKNLSKFKAVCFKSHGSGDRVDDLPNVGGLHNTIFTQSSAAFSLDLRQLGIWQRFDLLCV